PVGKDGMAGVSKAGIEDRELALVLKRGRVVAELVQKDAQRPNVRLFVERLLPVDVYHLGAAILQRRVLLDVLIHLAAFDDGGRRGARRGGGAKVAELETLRRALGGDENVFDLDVAVQQRGLEVVHAGDTLGNVSKDVDDLGLGQAML